MPAERRTPTIGDVARAAGVSVSTVSRVLRDHRDVRPETREIVQEAVRTLRYRPSSIARALVSGHSRLLALLVSDIGNPFYPQLARRIEREAARRGYTMVICSTDDSPAESARYLDRLSAHGVAGIIHASVGDDEAAVLGEARGEIPIVFTNRRPRSSGQHYVVSDNEGGAQLLTEHLLSLGHRQIGFIAGPSSASPSAERLRGFLQTMARTPGAVPLVFTGRFEPDTGQAAVLQWLQVDRPTAIIGVNDLVSMGAIEGLLALGLRIPEDMSVASFDDVQMASSRMVGLTTVAQDIDQLARRAVQILFRLLESSRPIPPVQQVLPTTLNVRRTAGPPARIVPEIGERDAG